MGEFVYTTVPGKVKSLLAKIREVGIPKKVTQQWMKSLGYTSSNDGSLIGILKFIKMTDESGVPTPRWAQYRGANYRKVLGEAVREGYAELYAVYDDAHLRPQSDLEHVFSTSTSAGRQVIAKTISTFKAVAEEADFGSIGENASTLEVEPGPLHAAVAGAPSGRPRAGGPLAPSLHMDIQIHIAADASLEQIDRIFESMAKHLYGAV